MSAAGPISTTIKKLVGMPKLLHGNPETYFPDLIDNAGYMTLDEGCTAIRVNGRLLVIGIEPPPEQLAEQRFRDILGSGGTAFRVTFTTGPRKGEELITHNLWSFGAIPDEYRDRLPDNATLEEVRRW